LWKEEFVKNFRAILPMRDVPFFGKVWITFLQKAQFLLDARLDPTQLSEGAVL
jgi:hypothetical protein